MDNLLKASPVLRVVHLDDDPFELDRVRDALENHGVDCRFTVRSAGSVADYFKFLESEKKIDVIILDVNIGDETLNGIDLVTRTRQRLSHPVILMCSTADDVATIADCLNAGADDFISKQSDKGELSLRVYNSYRLAKLKMGDIAPPGLKDAAGGQAAGATIEGIRQRVPRIIQSAITAVFIRGESGTGKEVVADLFGQHLPDRPFIKVNCGAIAPTLLESELFGHVKGAFTGAVSDKRGLFEAANGGWIFLDEVATLSSFAQVALLRVLENHEIIRVGATKPIAIDIRVLAATNEPMEQLVRDGRFRADLWQRLREAEIYLPPLRDRPNEIKDLVGHFCKIMPGGPYSVTNPVMQILMSYPWRQGNIRELRNCLRAMTEMHIDKVLTPLAIPERIREQLRAGATDSDASDEHELPLNLQAEPGGLREITLRCPDKDWPNMERLDDLLLVELIRTLFREQGKYSLRSLAQVVGISRSTLSTRLKALVQRNVIDIAELSRMVGVQNQ